jgi:hypothetical protein
LEHNDVSHIALEERLLNLVVGGSLNFREGLLLLNIQFEEVSVDLTSGAPEQDFLEEVDLRFLDVTSVVDHLVVLTDLAFTVVFLEKACLDLLLIDINIL